MTVSRNSEPFRRRNGLMNESESPGPRLDIGALLVANLPQTGVTVQATLIKAEGDPPADRGVVRVWPYE